RSTRDTPRDGGARRPGGGRLRGGSRRRDRPSRRRPPRGAGAPAVRAGRARGRSAGPTAALRGEIAAGLAIVGREVPFVLALPAGTPRVFLHGRLDLLARRGPAHVVRDYKYARPAPAALESYAPQLGAYQLAVGAAGAAAVEAELVFLRGGPVVRRLPPLDARREAAALVDAGVALGQALASGAVDAFPRRPE